MVHHGETYGDLSQDLSLSHSFAIIGLWLAGRSCSDCPARPGSSPASYVSSSRLIPLRTEISRHKIRIGVVRMKHRMSISTGTSMACRPMVYSAGLGRMRD